MRTGESGRPGVFSVSPSLRFSDSSLPKQRIDSHKLEGNMADRELNFGQALNEAMRQEMRRDPKVILMGEDVAGGADVEHLQGDDAWGGVLGVTKGLVKEFGRERILDTPIS